MKILLNSALLLVSALTPAAAADQPNILLVLFDDLGYSDLGCYGGEIATPNIDSLARHGLRFTHLNNSARCCPTRASLLTGLHPAQAGIPNFDGQLSANSATLAEVLRGAGYGTYMAGKWHVGNSPQASPTARGFDEFYGYTNGHSAGQWEPKNYKRLPANRTLEKSYGPGKFYATDAFTDYAMEFIRQGEAARKPWFVYLAHSSPHFPIQAPIESMKPYLDTYRKGWDVLRGERFKRLKQIGLIDHDGWHLTPRSLVPVEANNAIANGYSGQPNPAWDSLDAARREDLAYRMAHYAAMVKHVDDGIGRIVNQLKETGTFENTVILILSDNGACYEWGPFGFDGQSRAGTTTLHQGDALTTMGGPGTHLSYGSGWANLCNTPFRLYKHFTHEGGILTPFIIHWPKGIQQPDRWVRDPAHVMDVMPTLVELSGATYPRERNGKPVTPVEGLSLAPTFRSTAALPERAICIQHERAYAIRKGQWKLVMGKRFPREATWELYDIKSDPTEMNDLAANHPELVASLSNEWQAWAERTGTLKPAAGNQGKKKAKPQPAP
jgi:arylsulfatase